MTTNAPTWWMTDQEKRKALSMLAGVAASFIGPLGPVAVWAAEYIYERRDLLFDRFGNPLQAFQANRCALSLSSVGLQSVPIEATLSIDTKLTKSAKELGLRKGDPVSLVVTGDKYVQSRSGLIVPARIGERVTVAVPTGGYALTAFGSRRDALFTVRDPYQAAAGENLQLGRENHLELRLTNRSLLTPKTLPIAAVPGDQKARERSARRPSGLGTACVWCGKADDSLAHLLACSQRPTSPPSRVMCSRCYAFFDTSFLLNGHIRDAHPTVWERFRRAVDRF